MDGNMNIRCAVNRMPMIGIGTYQMKNEDVLASVIDAGLSIGYRSIDTAACYKNESIIGNILKSKLVKYDLSRDDVFLTSKLHPKDLGSGSTRVGFIASLSALDVSYIDLYLIHWPGKQKVKAGDPRNKEWRVESWRELIKLKDEGLVRNIGVSNFSPFQIEALVEATGVLPLVNQVEIHPHYPQTQLLKYCREKGVHLQAYSSFGSPNYKQKLFEDKAVMSLSLNLGICESELLLAWALNQNISVLPRTTNCEHLAQNWKAQHISLTVEQIHSLKVKDHEAVKYCWNPEEIL